ncbi:hypothetical protein [Pseudomonas sp. MYb118]|uniref:hypothetical protein n=1 Tax=Pseudomonas sp. MYb118 TaxID=1848720 RepID=UPI0034CEF2E6
MRTDISNGLPDANGKVPAATGGCFFTGLSNFLPFRRTNGEELQLPNFEERWL